MIANFQNPLFIDIETVSITSSYDQLSEGPKPLWFKKATYLGATTEEEKVALFFEKAGIFAEFGKVITIALGYITGRGQDVQLHVKSIASHDEVMLLKTLADLLNRFPQDNLQLCAHNGKEFDFPYLCRRKTIQGIPLPNVLQIAGKKPWEVNHLDTMELWKFGDRKTYTSLDLLAQIFQIPSSKTLMDGSQVNHYYYVEKDLKKIAEYCEQDVIVTAQLFRKLHFLPIIQPDVIISAEKSLLSEGL